MITPGRTRSLTPPAWLAATFAAAAVAVAVAAVAGPPSALAAPTLGADATDRAEETLVDTDAVPGGFVLAPVGDGGVTGPVTERRLQLLSFNEDQARLIEEADPAGYARVWTSDAEDSVLVAVAVLVQGESAADTLVERFADAVSAEVAVPFEVPDIEGARAYRVELGNGFTAVAFSHQSTVFLLSGLGAGAGQDVVTQLAIDQSAKAVAGPDAGVTDGGRETDDDPDAFRPVIASVGAVLALAVLGGVGVFVVRSRAEG